MVMSSSNSTAQPVELSPEQVAARKEAERQRRNATITIIVIAVIIVTAIIAAFYLLFRPETSPEQVGRVRDVFIIVVAFESLLIGAAMIILMLQLASLTNLLQNEVKPILTATSETVNNLRGTAEFLGENVVEPVIKLNGYLAGLQRVLELMGIKKK